MVCGWWAGLEVELRMVGGVGGKLLCWVEQACMSRHKMSWRAYKSRCKWAH